MTFGEYLGAGSAVTQWLYHLNGNANDDSWAGNNWTATNISWVDGLFWQCGSFNGSNSRITWITNWSYGWASWQRTLSVWINISALPANNVTRYVYTATDSSTSSDFQLILFNDAWTHKLIYWRWRFNVVFANMVTYTTPLNRFVNMVVVQDVNDNYIYIDWVLLASATMTWNWTWATNTWVIWANTTNNNVFNWLIDEVIIENRVWTAVETQKYYTYAKWRFWIL
jgi:hypothetical protein